MLKESVKQLSTLNGISGRENDVRDFKVEMIQAMYRQGGFSTDFITNLATKIT